MSDDPAPLADRLLDAQVAFVVEQLIGPSRDEIVTALVDDLLAAAGSVAVGDVVDGDAVTATIQRLLARVPASTAASTFTEALAGVLHAGPDQPFCAADLIDREQVEQIVDEVVAAKPIIAAALDDLAETPLIADVTSRFLARLIGDVLATNRAVAEKVPGLGGLVSFGAGAASKVVGAGGGVAEQLLGDTAGKGAQLATRRLNQVLVDTLDDPALTAGLLQLWDARSARPLPGLDTVASADDVRRVAGLVQDVVITAAASDPVGDLAQRLVSAFLDVYGDETVATLLTDLAIERDDLVADARLAAERAVTAAAEAGELDRLVRGRLEPFYRSAAFAAAVDA